MSGLKEPEESMRVWCKIHIARVRFDAFGSLADIRLLVANSNIVSSLDGLHACRFIRELAAVEEIEFRL